MQNKEVEISEEQHPSPFERFLVKAFNMLKIWEMILSDITVQDVANCLKVNHGLRMALGQCISYNTRLRQKLDAAATVKTLNRGTVMSTSVVQISHEDKYGFFRRVVSMDGTWFYLQKSKDGTSTIRLDSEDKNVVHCYYSYDFTSIRGNGFMVHPTRNPKHFYIRDTDKYPRDTLIEKQSRSVKQITPFKKRQKLQDMENELERYSLTPYCAKYKLYESRENGSRKVFMRIYGYRDVYLFTLNEIEQQKYPLRDLPCNEQVSYYTDTLPSHLCSSNAIYVLCMELAC